MRVYLKPVYSKLAADIPLELRHLNIALSEHQVATFHALNNDAIKLIFNVSLTGDGKSLAGQLQLFHKDLWNIVAMYPTNELIRDQWTGIERFVKQHIEPAQSERFLKRTRLVDSRQLDAEQHRHAGDLSRGETLQTVFKNARLLLTNPDIFHVVMQFGYGRFGSAKDYLASGFWSATDQLIFDEFHLFDTPQIAALLTALILINRAQQLNSSQKVVFLSATPDDDLLKLFNQAGFTSEEICMIEGTYCYEAADPTQWRQILQAASLTFSNLDCMTWLDQHLTDVLYATYKQYPSTTRGAIIVDSVDRAIKIYERLQHDLAELNLTISINTGIQRSTKWNQADLVVATSTVDVGVDFAINLLVFEGTDASRCIQRLGRLGRHSSFLDCSGVQQAFTQYQAYALVPNYIYQRLSHTDDSSPADFTEEQYLTRAQLNTTLIKTFPSRRTFPGYLRDWGKYIPAKVLMALCDKSIYDTYAPLRKMIRLDYARVFNISTKHFNEAVDDLRGKNLEPEVKKRLLPLYQEACSFRGGSTLKNAAVLLAPRILHTDVVTEYNLLWLLQRAKLEVIAQTVFLDELKRRAGDDSGRMLDRYRDTKRFMAYFRLDGFLDKYRDLTVNLAQSRQSDFPEGSVHTVLGLNIEIFPNDISAFDELNEELLKQRFVITTLAMPPQQVRSTYYLPGHFSLYPCTFRSGRSGTVAFDREALLLDSILHKSKLNSDSSQPVFS